MKVFSGTANQPFADAIMRQLCLHTTSVEGVQISKFPDGEIHVKYNENIRGKDVFIIQSMSAPVNDSIMELLIMIDAARRSSAKRITAVIPFFAYARQDRKEQPRVPITAKLLSNILVSAGADRILTMDLHAPQIQGFFDIPVDHLQAMPAFIYHLNFMRLHNMVPEGADLNNFVVVAPDVGRSKVAVQYAKALKCHIAIVSKERISAEVVQSDVLVGEVKGKTAVIIDDLSTTGGTLIGAANLVKEHGATSVIAGVTHNVLTAKGIEKIQNSLIDLMLVTDTVNNPTDASKFAKVSVVEWFAKAIEAIHTDASVSSLFTV